MASSMSSSPNTNKDVSEVAEELGIITAPYGSWKSPITADFVTGASKRLGGTAVDGNGRLIWLESRPYESGYRYRFIRSSILNSLVVLLFGFCSNRFDFVAIQFRNIASCDSV